MRRRRWYRALLLAPVLAGIYPPLYNRATPALAGLPFFYWYLLGWTLACGALCGLVVALDRRARER